MSHAEKAVVKDIMNKVSKRYKGLEIKIGNKHTYLGMDLKYNEDGTISIGMDDYVEEVIEAFGTQMKITSGITSLARGSLFAVDENSDRLDEKRSKIFHHCVAKLLYVSKRCRLDIMLAVSFLRSRVSCSTEEDWLKLKGAIRYLYYSKHRNLTLGADSLSIINVFVDASYAVYPDMKSHTGGCIVLE